MEPNIALQDNARAEIAALLSNLLAGECILSQKTCNAHWNIVGPDFHAMHGFFESQYHTIEKFIAEVAGCIRALEYDAPGSLLWRRCCGIRGWAKSTGSRATVGLGSPRKPARDTPSWDEERYADFLHEHSVSRTGGRSSPMVPPMADLVAFGLAVVEGFGIGEQGGDLAVEGFVVGLEGEEVVGSGEVDLLRDLFLAAHGVEADGGASHFELAQELGHGGDSVGLAVDSQLAEGEAAAVGPGADEVEAAVRVALVEAVAQRLAVDGDESACQIGTDGADAGDEAFDEGFWDRAR
jgi:hypothetical protein